MSKRFKMPQGRRFWRGLGWLADKSVIWSFGKTGYAIRRRTFHENDLNVDLFHKVALVTGANSGLGFITARELARRGAEVYLLCRNAERGQAALVEIRREIPEARVTLELVDMSSLASVRDFVDRFAPRKVDILVHNAGVLPDQRIMTDEGIELTWATHVAGPFLMTQLLEDKLAQAHGARVVLVSSGGMYLQKLDLDDLDWKNHDFDGLTAYANSKRAQVILAEMWAERLADKQVNVNSMHPGWVDTGAVKTSMPRFYNFMRDLLRTPEQGADTLVWLAASPAVEGVSGHFWFDRERKDPYAVPFKHEDEDDRERLWQQLMTASGLNWRGQATVVPIAKTN